MVFLIKKSVAKEILKSLGKNKLEELKREVIEILKKQDEKEYKKALSQFENEEKNMSYLEKSISGEWIEKAGYGIGTVRVWKGKKYKKIAPGKWARMYEKEGRGTNIAVGHLIAKVKKIDDVEELMNFVMQNKQRFQDENGMDLPILDKIRAEVDRQSGKIESKGKSENTEKKEEKQQNNKQGKEETSDSLREKYKEKDKEYSEIIQKLIYARDHDQDTSKYDEKATKIQKELSDIENKIKNAEYREVKRSGKPSDFTLDDINSQKTVKTIEDFEDVIKEIDKIKDDYEAADKYMDFLASNIEGGFGGKLRRAIKRKYKSENLRDLAREVKGRKPLDTRDVSYADEYANKEEEKSKKKENSKNMTPKQQKTFDDFEKKAIKKGGKLFAKHNYNIDGEDWTITTDGTVMLCSKEKFEEPTKTDKIFNMDKVFKIDGQKESAIPDGIDAIIKTAPKTVVTGKDYKGKEKKESSIIKLGDRYFNADYLKTVQNFLGPLSNVKMQVIPGDNESRVKFESGNKAVVLLPIKNGAELENRIINTNDIKKSLEDIIMFCNDFEDEDEVIEEINNVSLFSDYSAENPSEFNSIKYKVANAFEECGY